MSTKIVKKKEEKKVGVLQRLEESDSFALYEPKSAITVVDSAGRHQITSEGRKYLTSIAAFDLSIDSAAALFDQSKDWLTRRIKNDKSVEKAWRKGKAQAELEFKQARRLMKQVSAPVNIHEGKVKHGEIEVTRQENTHIHVVGTFAGDDPDFDADAWRKQFEPKVPKQIKQEGQQ